MKHSIRVKIVAICVGTLVLTLLLLWALNKFFLEDFYSAKKIETFVNNYEDIDNMIQEEAGNEEFSMKIQRMRDSDNITYLRTRSDWSVFQSNSSPSEQKLMLARLQASTMLPSSEVSIMKQGDMEKGEVYIIQKSYNKSMQSFYLECFGTFSDGSSFLMSSPLESIKDSVVISNQFLIEVGGVLLLLSAAAIYAVTRKLTRPILELANLSSRMAHLDFEAHYEGSNGGELGVLGDSMNHLSDELKRTISELQTANVQLQKDIEEKIQIDEMRKEFLSNVSHELKTPIALIQGYAEGLQEVVNEDPESQDYYCEVIVDEAGKMNKMVQKLLTLNHLEFGQETLNMEVFDLAELVRGVVSASSIMIQQKEAEVIILAPESLLAVGDEFKIEEVITNYLTNALNHVDYAKKITIRMEEMKGKIRISVHNTGDPIPEEDLDKVWIKFFKVDKARTRAYGGSGIGLSIVKAIMDSMHQKVGVCNQNGGVTFWFELEKADPEAEGCELYNC